ncbi:hypothetical protein L873DRAFT_1796848 [Choiromyces venosus 120613-1]|uniref:Uncharacterized protein n=1 Tax=Choiromyces venosus 120613-1 TaxID=1336337 RepID=A0A3N4KJH8_9PEZI|nr:hypothetical protein L873DRAFT_1796848 [Choiromyces venosus 120613-1]
MESWLTSFEQTLHKIKGQIVISRDVQQRILQASEVKKTISSNKEFVDVPNSLTREVNIFKTLKLISKKLGDLERLLTQTTLKVTKDENMDLKSAEYFDPIHLLAFLSKNGMVGLEASVLIRKKLDMQKILSECITEEKSKFESILKNSTYWNLPIAFFAEQLFLPKVYNSTS